MDLKKYLAKSNGENIIEHTDKSNNNTEFLIKKYNINKPDSELLLNSSTLHDIAKLIKRIQTFLKTNTSINDNDKLKFGHNIIAWWFIIKYVKLDNKDKIANLVLWHHANNNNCDNLNLNMFEIGKLVSEKDLNLMFAFCKHYNIPLNNQEVENYDSKTQFYELNNFLRSILITSDVCASAGIDVKNLFKSDSISYDKLDKDFLNTNRTQEQLSIVNSITPNTTTLLKAPTGFGKSVLGILFAMRSEKSVIWVLPTNVMCESIYDDIIENLKLIGIHIDIELYLTGESIKRNNELPEFSSKIIVTNIDNFIKPTVTNSYGTRCLMIYDCDVIFDEVQDYDNMRCALNSSFNSIMDIRHNQLDVTTLFLTATPPSFRFLNKNGKNIVFLPNETTHYNSVHNETFELIFHDTVPYNLMNGEFIFFSHLVDDAQKYYNEYNGLKLISHGRYLEEDKDYKKSLVLSNYGKNGERTPYAVFTNQFLTTACDYSVNTMFIKCPTLIDFSQSLGRINRWGGMENVKIHIILEKSEGDRYFMGGGGDEENELQQIFIKELRERFEGVKMTLNEFYSFYNIFKTKYDDLFKQISIKNLVLSKNMLKNVFAKKKKEVSKDKKIANGNKLRKNINSDGMFIYVKRSDSSEWVSINYSLNTTIGRTKTFDENEKTYFEQLKIIKTFDEYNKHKKITPELLFKQSYDYYTPYPVFNYSYNSEIGLFKDSLFS